MRTPGIAIALLGLALSACSPGISGVVPLRLAERSLLAADSIEEVHQLLLGTPTGDTLTAVLRRPAAAAERRELPGILLVAGRETGRAAASVIPGPIQGVVLALEYPAVLPGAATPGAILPRLPGIRRSAYAFPGLLRGAARFLADQPEVDPSRIALVGVSFGVPFAAAAAPDPVFCCVALHHGGADLGLLFRRNLPIDDHRLRGAVARFLAGYFRLLEPARYVGRIAPRPLLLVNGIRDEMVPREAALLLAERARPPLRHIWLPHEHLMPDDHLMMRELADSTLSHFPELGRR